jgi:hypothetical protein
MSIGKCGFCNSEILIEHKTGKVSNINGLKSVMCQDCGRNSYTRGKIPKLKKRKISSFVGMRLDEALMAGLPIGSIIFTISGPHGPGLVMEEKDTTHARHVNGRAIYFEKHREYAMGWLDSKIREVQLPKKAKKK